MNSKEEKKKVRTLHDYLGIHNWEFFSAKELSTVGHAISNERRACRDCDKVEWTYGLALGEDEEDRVWYSDNSAFATNAIHCIREKRHVQSKKQQRVME